MQCNHLKKHYVINGCSVTVSFSETSNPDLFAEIKSILLTPGASSQIRHKSMDPAMIQKKQRGRQNGTKQGLLPVPGFNG
jgi:hypothetical protein